MNAREERGRLIAETCDRTKMGDEWFVPSPSGGRRYIVKPDPDAPPGTCPDVELRGMKCKHIFAVEFSLTKVEQHAGGTTTVGTVTVKVQRETYKPDRPNYNAAQVNDRRLFHTLLADLGDTITGPPRKTPSTGGRPPIPLRDAAFAAGLKVYSRMSARRFPGESDEARDGGFVRHAPHVNTVPNVFDREETTPILRAVIETSALPLRTVETVLAVDPTGSATATYASWFDQKYGVTRKQARRVKAHVTTGVKTNVVTAVNIDHQDAADRPQFPARIDATAAAFTVTDGRADKAYVATANFDAVESHGGPFFPAFESNTTGAVGGSFAKAFHDFRFKRDEYLVHDHQRSNVETTVSVVKRTFGDSVKAKNELAQKNEVYAKFVCHNICVLVAEMYAMGIQANFDRPGSCTNTVTAAQKPLQN